MLAMLLQRWVQPCKEQRRVRRYPVDMALHFLTWPRHLSLDPNLTKVWTYTLSHPLKDPVAF